MMRRVWNRGAIIPQIIIRARAQFPVGEVGPAAAHAAGGFRPHSPLLGFCRTPMYHPQMIRIGLLILILIPAASAAGLDIHIVSQTSSGAISDRQPVETLLRETVTLHALIQRGRGDRAEFFSDFDGAARIGEREVQVKRWAGAAIAWRWYKVEPLMMHKDKGNDPTVPSFLWYTNAYVPGSPKQSKGWIGFDKIQYADNLLTSSTGAWRIVADAHPTDRRYDFAGGLGTMRFKLAAELDGKPRKTPGAEATNYFGIEPKVFRLSVRRDDTLLGHALAFINLPGVYGSHELQVEHRIGVDCADLMVAAWRGKTGSKMEYTSVNGLIEKMEPVGGVWLLSREQSRERRSPERQTPIDDAVLTPETPGEKPLHCEPGMVIVFDYPGTVKGYYDHIGMLYELGPNNLLTAQSLMLHCGPLEPRVSPISTQGGTKNQPTRVRAFRWRE